MNIPNDERYYTDQTYENAVLTYDRKVRSVQENLRENALLMLSEWVENLNTNDPALDTLNQGIVDLLFDNYPIKLRLVDALTDSQWSEGEI